MAGEPITFDPIGTIHTPFVEQKGTPIQSRYAEGAEGFVELDERYRAALRDVEGFERVWLLFHCHRARPWRAVITPYRDDRERGLFATRAPSRPNPIGLSVVRVLAVEPSGLRVADVDVLDGTPLLDLKPYVPEFDAYPSSRAGWLDQVGEAREEADERFVEK